MTALANSPTGSEAPTVGARTELARHSLSDGTERVLFGQRVDGVVRVVDRPRSGAGRSYLVERELEQEGYGANAALTALIADYLREACRLDDVPMRASTLRHYLEQLADRWPRPPLTAAWPGDAGRSCPAMNTSMRGAPAELRGLGPEHAGEHEIG
jgi:hypothetical protein